MQLGVVDVTVDAVDVTAEDSGDDVTEVVDVIVDSDDDDAKMDSVPTGGPPVRFHGYHRGRELGRGVSGQVFVASKPGCASGFAVKAVDLRRIRLSPNAEREQKKLRREVEILRVLPPHENIIQLMDAFEEGDWFLLVLELVGGGDLYTVLTAREPPRLLEREASYVTQQLVEGLAFLHGQGIIHRDLKLENVLVASEKRQRPLVLYKVKITDFGLSKAVGYGLSEACSTVGTQPYTAPEVLREGSHDFTSDLWCLGVLLYVLLAGHFPFDKMAPSQLQIDEIACRLKVSKAAKSIVAGLLRLEPGKRITLESIQNHEWLKVAAQLNATERRPKRKRVPSEDEAELLELPEQTTPIMGPAGDSESAGEEVPEVPMPPAAVPAAPLEPEPEAEQAAPEPAAPEVPSPSMQPEVPDVVKTEVGQVSPGVMPSAPSKLPVPPKFTDARPASARQDVLQVHMRLPSNVDISLFAHEGALMKQISATAGCQAWTTTPDIHQPNRYVVMIGNVKQCVIVQELVHEQLTVRASSDNGQRGEIEVEVTLLIRSEAAGVVIGKQGFVLKQIRNQSGAWVQLFREETHGHRPCHIKGPLNKVLRAERHIFDLVRAVPLAVTGPFLPRVRLSRTAITGTVLSWRGKVGWIHPEGTIHYQGAAAHRGNIYVHEKDVTNGRSLQAGQKVSFHVYSDKSGLGAEECAPIWPRTRLREEHYHGKVVAWKGKVGWIEPLEVVEHPDAPQAYHHGHIYVHLKDTAEGRPLAVGQQVRFRAYLDKTGL
eukprot:CAMPEP_0178384274 /NCGR_PEP_ID=MMETSP0689_2-20121128/7431_1 /TAXON_ID=160604 /ORGANISM="Amphidinium massartii, Strain CS-259" /LENGTH=769 /DNA_ID=CAMNT_0020004517 /DNA_START=114 /DNA_END=2420 /DNA_ORIENTATION=-